MTDGSRKYHRDVSLALAGACHAAGYKGYPAVAMTPGPRPNEPAVVEVGGGFHGRLGPTITEAIARRHAGALGGASGLGGLGCGGRRGFWR